MTEHDKVLVKIMKRLLEWEITYQDDHMQFTGRPLIDLDPGDREVLERVEYEVNI